MRTLVRAGIMSLVSGAIWSLGLFGNARPGVWLVVGPLIGLAAGLACARFPYDSLLGGLAFSLVSLYATAVLFALSIGIEVVYMVVGLTYSVIVLWPLSYLNHMVIARVWDEGRERAL